MTQYLSCRITLPDYDVLTVSHRYDGVIVLTTTRVLLCTGDLHANSVFAEYCPHAKIIDVYQQYSDTHGVKLASAIALMHATPFVNDRTNRIDNRIDYHNLTLKTHPDTPNYAMPRQEHITVQDVVIQWGGLVNDYDSRHHQYHVRGGVIYVTSREDITHFRMLSMYCRYHIVTMHVALRVYCIPDMISHILAQVLHLYRVDESLPTVVRS